MQKRGGGWRRLGLVGILLLSLLAACKPASTRVLFIGNSFTFYNDGIDRQLEGLDHATDTSNVVAGGYTLQTHLDDGKALDAIRQGGWDYVVLQEQSQRPVIDPQAFFQAVRDFDIEVRAAGGQTVLLMTWERPDSVQYGITTAALAKAYTDTGKTLGLKVAPAGLAFARALQQRPDLNLYVDDGHPTLYGTYLAACVVYATIYEKSPVGIQYAPKGISDDTRDFLQKVAGETLGY